MIYCPDPIVPLFYPISSLIYVIHNSTKFYVAVESLTNPSISRLRTSYITQAKLFVIAKYVRRLKESLITLIYDKQ